MKKTFLLKYTLSRKEHIKTHLKKVHYHILMLHFHMVMHLLVLSQVHLVQITIVNRKSINLKEVIDDTMPKCHLAKEESQKL